MSLGNISEWLSFDDVLLLPVYSKVFKDGIDLSANLTKDIKLKIPLVAAPMDTVCEWQLATELARLGGLGILHRNLTITEEASQVRRVKEAKTVRDSAVDKKGRLLIGAAVGAGEDLYPRIKSLIAAEVDLICLDSAHGHADYIIKATREIKKKYPKIPLISGNVGHAGGFERLVKAGADAVKVGVGPGSICTTRLVTGVGAPQISAIADCAPIAKKYQVGLIADGGIKQPGDITKALSAGGWTVMIGSLLARVKESPGKVVTVNGKKYKQYRGMGSIAAMKKGSANRYGQGMEDKRLVAEGVEGLVPYKGTLKESLFQFIGGLKAGMEYIGADSIPQMWQKARFVRISHAGLVESHPHSLIITNPGESYNGK